MDDLSSLLAVASLVLALLSVVAVFFPELAKKKRSASAFATYFIPAIVAITVAVAISPTKPAPTSGNENLIPVGSSVDTTADIIPEKAAITSTENGWACVTEGALVKLIEVANAGDRDATSRMLGGECFETHETWTIHVQEVKEQSVSYSRVGDKLFWTTPDNIRWETF